MTSISATAALESLVGPWLANGVEPAPRGAALDDIELLGRRCRAGEVAAWEELFPRVWPVLVTFVHRLYGRFERADAEDVAQLTLEAALRSARSFSGRGSFRGWLFGIATRQASNHHRVLGAAKRGAARLEPLGDETDAPAAEGLTPAEALSARERAEILDRALLELPASDRELVQLRFFGDLTCEEIGQLCQLNAKTVATRLHRARQALLVLLRRHHLTSHDG